LGVCFLRFPFLCRVAEYERKKREKEEAIRNKRAANPKTELGKGTVLTPEQIAARFGNVAKKTVPGEIWVVLSFFWCLCCGGGGGCSVFSSQVCLTEARLEEPTRAATGGRATADGPAFESLARRALDEPPAERRTRREELFEKSILGNRAVRKNMLSPCFFG
jgi:hypothetical protein